MKRINDAFGHEAGDCALVDIAALSRVATCPGDVVARLGGDELVVLVLGSESDGAARMSRLRHGIAAFNAANERSYELWVSIGCAVYQPLCGRTLDELLCTADVLMYEDKQQRRLRGSLPVRAA